MTEELIKLTDEQKRLAPQIREFFEALKKQRYSLSAKEYPMFFDGEEEDIPEEVRDLFRDTDEELGDPDEYPKSLENIFKSIELLERGYLLESLIEINELDVKVDNTLWESIENDIVFTSFTVDEVEDLNLKCPFFNCDNDIYEIVFALDPDLYWHYRLIIQEGCGMVMYLKYTDSFPKDVYDSEDGFESVSYNLITKEMSVGSYISVE